MSLYSKVRKIGEKSGIGQLHPHMLRCTYLVRLYNKKNDLRFVQDQAGHANIKTTALYAKMTRELLKEAASDNVSSYVQNVGVLKDRSKKYKVSIQKTIIDKETDYLDDSQQSITCEVCNNPIKEINGTKIDSGQVLCNSCLRELRNHVSKNN
jgi:hypothetical protein